MTDKTLTRSQKIAVDVDALLRARNPFLWVVTTEEARVEGYLIEAAAAAGYVPRTWDVGQGVLDMAGRVIVEVLGNGQRGDELKDPGDALNTIRDRAERFDKIAPDNVANLVTSQRPERGVWIMRDLPAWLSGPAGMTTLRQVRNLARMLPGTQRHAAQAIVVISPSGDIPAELRGHATMIEWPLPDREEIADILDTVLEGQPDDIRASGTNGKREAAIDAAVGLAGEEAQACYAKSIVQTRSVDPVMVAQEKKRVIARERVLEWYDPIPGGLDAVGGLDLLKVWLKSRAMAYSPEARAYGLPAPKGALLVGVPGCGKSLTAKAIATAWGVPLLRMDLGALKSKFVGESERNLRAAFNVIKALGRCVVWLDEIEKALQGATSGASDGGVSSDALGAILSWMQERQGEAFVIATANDVSSLPPELLRKGRFDEVWFVDLPNISERMEIVKASLKQYGRDVTVLGSGNALDVVARACEGFTGSEIAALVPDAMFNAFADGKRELTGKDLLEAVKTVTPLSKTASDKIEKLREWQQTRGARRATSESEVVVLPEARRAKARALDI